MRQSSTNVALITFDGADAPAGLCLGGSHCAEHEMGMKPLERALGVGARGDRGLAAHLTQPVDPSDRRLAFSERKKGTKTIPAEARLVFHPIAGFAENYADPKTTRRIPAVWMDEGKPSVALATGWDEDCFIIRAFGEEERQMVRDLYLGFQEGDVLLSFAASSNPFDRGGPCLTLRSRISDEHDQQVADAQDAYHAAKGPST